MARRNAQPQTQSTHRATRNRPGRLVFALILGLLLIGCASASSSRSVQAATVGVTNQGGEAVMVSSMSVSEFAPGQPVGEGGLVFGLSDGTPGGDAVAQLPVAPAEPLSADETAALIARLAALTGQIGDKVDFNLPEAILPPPRPGDTVESTFPPQEDLAPPVQPDPGPLAVLRYSPVGDVALAPFLSVTFNQPMIPLTSLEDMADLDMPVKLTPQPEGTWRWVGTKTVLFEPTTRFPMATEYEVAVPAGIVSQAGKTLDQTVTWTFTTPPPTLQNSYPGGQTVRNPIFFAAFDQQIDPAAVLKTVAITAGGQTFTATLVTADEVATDFSVVQAAKSAGEGRWLAFRAGDLLPYNTTVTVNIGPGTPSVEGPRTTETVQSFSFTTFGPMSVTDAGCSWGTQCPPLAPWYVNFSNAINMDGFDPAMVVFNPALPGAKIDIYGNTMNIQGRSSGRTTYKVTLKAGIPDIYDQVLAEDKTVTITVGSAEPSLYSPADNFVVLDPAAATPAVSVFSINYAALTVKAYRVSPDEWPAYLDYRQNLYQRDNPPTPPGTKVLDTKVRVNGDADAWTETAIDLADALVNGKGNVILLVEPDRGLLGTLLNRYVPTVTSWVQVTNIGLDAFVDGGQMTAWANSLTDGAPLADVSLTLNPGLVKTGTGLDGTATLALTRSGSNTPAYLVATLDGDTAILPENPYWYSGAWLAQPQTKSLVWYVFDDRQMYRPGEEVHVKGWMRVVSDAKDGDVESLASGKKSVSFTVQDPTGNTVGQGQADVNALGGFDFVVELPTNINLGYANLQLYAQGVTGADYGLDYYHQFQVQEFRRPEFEVTATAADGPHFLGDSATATVDATYFAGGPLANAEVYWNVTAMPGSYTPPNWDDFTFGTWTPWWGWGRYGGGYGVEVERAQQFQGKTDSAGSHTVNMTFETLSDPQATTVTAEATVMDVNRQAWTASTTLLVHPADLYVGMKSDRYFVQQGEPLDISVIVVDLDGNPVADVAVEVTAVRLDWTYKSGSWQEVEADNQSCALTSTEEALDCTFQPTDGGQYRLTATVRDGRERLNKSQITRWVSGGTWPTAQNVEQEEAQLIPDKQEYQPGDVAEILVQAPFAPAEGLLTLRRNGIIHTERFSMPEGSTTLRIPVEEAHIPNVYVQVDLVGAAARLNAEGKPDTTLPDRPAYAMGSLNLSVPPLSRTLAVTAVPAAGKLQPGAETSVTVTVVDATGEPVADAEVALVVVDEAILSLTGYDLTDPVQTFYSQRGPGTGDYHLRGSILLVDPNKLLENAGAVAQTASRDSMAFGAAVPMTAEMPMAMAESASMDMAKGMATPGEPIRLRSDFNPLASWAPASSTGPDGSATVVVKLPDNLTRYRIVAVAVDAGGKQFGKGESSLTARLPIMVRPSAPRFANFGDLIELPIVVQNQTDTDLSVDVAVDALNMTLLDGAGKRITVPANDRVEVRFPMTTQQAGTARFQVAVSAGDYADAAQFEFPVYTPATTEAFAVYGVVDAGAIAQPVIAPTGVFTQFGGLEISTSSTALQALTDAVLYLTSYPYECSEQLASRVLSVAAFKDVLTAFQADGLPAPDVLLAAVDRDIAKLQGMQNYDGGFPIWQKGDESWPFYSIHATHALVEAQQKGFTVPAQMMADALTYMRNVENYYPSYYSQDVRNTLTSYALFVRKQMGDVDTAKARSVLNSAGVDKLQAEAVGWLYAVMVDDAGSAAELATIRTYLGNRVVETAGAANFTTTYREEDGYLLLASNRRADAVILDALISDQPDSDLIPKLVTGLLANRTQGRWGNTQENVFVLLSLDKYFNTYEAQTPDFVAKAWLGEQYVAGFTFEGRSTDYQSVSVPMSYLAEQGQQDLILSKEGDGRLYYRLGLNYAPTSLDLAPLDAGFTVLRTYEAVDDPADVRQDEDGTWIVKAGARVRVRLTMVAPNRRYHVALVDPLPAGFESLNPALAVTGSLPQDPSVQAKSPYWWWSWTWYEHQNLRDERTEAFASLLWEGIHDYSYVARATTPGTFVVPPTKAEEMYSPEVFGRSGSDRVVIE
ncbi:MAG: Ig-like domain-containing protein [Caldilineaceae bacterium]|nr:Ig-like domain-containing protein [Caldilineaceae bacterium]MBP8109619.1 Ig-like domain-containing protein [Caldilineaceae bacterium]MBP8124491.1 Ig-like domain-containing protein [Caldilineaceae bacterium]MBP9074168.1 Ig-like domain-containing protein [Caldilineaceae bacterium]